MAKIKIKTNKKKSEMPEYDVSFYGSSFSLSNQDFVMTTKDERIFIKNCNNNKVYELINEINY